MRDDMDKILVERPRLGGGVKYPRGAEGKWGRISLDERPRREAIKRAWSDWRVQKHLNENLAPLRRFLRSRRGRPWDEVYSEIRERINPASPIQLHIWQHLMWEVARDRLAVAKARRYGFRGFYVDPETGILHSNPDRPRYRYRPSPSPIDFYVRFEGRYHLRIEGIWYEVDLAPLPRWPVWDAVQRKTTDVSGVIAELPRIDGHLHYAVRKRQLGKKEIRRLHEFQQAATENKKRCDSRTAFLMRCVGAVVGSATEPFYRLLIKSSSAILSSRRLASMSRRNLSPSP
jgi:hypothetical protein